MQTRNISFFFLSSSPIAIAKKLSFSISRGIFLEITEVSEHHLVGIPEPLNANGLLYR